MSQGLQKLVGQRLKSMEWSESEIKFHLENGSTIKFYAYGDCCSSSYIESLDFPDIFTDSVFLEFDIVSGPEKRDGDYDEVSSWTFYKFKTTKGMCTLSFRNDSNGYYNGCLEEF